MPTGVKRDDDDDDDNDNEDDGDKRNHSILSLQDNEVEASKQKREERVML